MIHLRRILTSSPHWPSDLAWVTSIYYEGMNEEIEQSPASQWRKMDLHRDREVSRFFEELVSREDRSCLLFVEVDQRRVGYFLGMIKDCLAETPAQMGYINGLYLLPSYRKMGLGQKLLNEGHAWFRSYNLQLVELYTACGNAAAKKFWMKNGYLKTEEVLISPL